MSDTFSYWKYWKYCVFGLDEGWGLGSMQEAGHDAKGTLWKSQCFVHS